MLHFFVINPHSFKTAKAANDLKQVLTDIENCFSDGRETDYEIYTSRYPRDAIAAIHRYITRIPNNETVRVYAVGGDGILFDCLNGMIDFPNAELTMLPYGSSNDFIKVFGEESNDIFRDVKLLSRASAKLVDVINCGSNYALNEVAFGMESQAVIYANKMFRHPYLKWTRKSSLLVSLVYKFGGTCSLMKNEIRRQRYEVLADGKNLSGSYCNISVSNGACIGGALMTSPYAKPNDGLLDVIFAAGGNTVQVASYIIDFTKGHFEKRSAFLYRQLRKLEINSDVPIRVQMDGESFYTDKIKLEVVPERIKFAVPDGLDFADYSYKAFKPANKKKGGIGGGN